MMTLPGFWTFLGNTEVAAGTPVLRTVGGGAF